MYSLGAASCELRPGSTNFPLSWAYGVDKARGSARQLNLKAVTVVFIIIFSEHFLTVSRPEYLESKRLNAGRFYGYIWRDNKTPARVTRCHPISDNGCDGKSSQTAQHLSNKNEETHQTANDRASVGKGEPCLEIPCADTRLLADCLTAIDSCFNPLCSTQSLPQLLEDTSQAHSQRLGVGVVAFSPSGLCSGGESSATPSLPDPETTSATGDASVCEMKDGPSAASTLRGTDKV
ncbi:uncharacterized protein BDZ83DRAFT_727158 [Colletotrichum acutatum]|uniref:Uncharacterized protein n=1 Tax=Glomerella acutata TaxID=27357 RepID=A0AAD8XLB6_GLOAC|nr:uncharacterized protein BDZ83DRAFT_727158 [Colletotrichum acutatum]KAK1729423.1 hypothetical protein BDZ83DRAFT_727158 [Colletotrichum acutatum]